MHSYAATERWQSDTASIVGATGYTGAILTDILAGHPEVALHALTSKSYWGKRSPRCSRICGSRECYAAVRPGALGGSDVVFVCYPHAEAHAVVAELIDAGCRVVDLSADFRLKDPEAYTVVVRVRSSPARPGGRGRLRSAEVYREQIADARLGGQSRAAIRPRCCWACFPVAETSTTAA